jgi:DNA repair exonuclease SbcCD ATPase subunit
MNEILKNELCQYLGQLMYEHENEFDWILKDKIAEKINAVNKLLDIDKHEKTWYENLAKKLK